MYNSILASDIADAIQGNKKTFKNNGVTYKLPTPQRTGTSTQQRAYAEQAAHKLINS
jgi:hypothetical protein